MKALNTYVTGTIERALGAAGLRSPRRHGAPTGVTPRLGDVAATIERALGAAGLVPAAESMQTFEGRTVPAAPQPKPAPRLPALPGTAGIPKPESRGGRVHARGVDLQRSFGNASGSRNYTLYVPATPEMETPRPLLLMLHGCTQDPDDFARGTAMNALADAHGLLVAYPQQPRRDNGSRCWNWFRQQDQQRSTGEASILAGIVDHVAADHRVDPRRVYVAGLSAGAAMAVILGRTHPDVFAAVGAHSGLPFGAAHDVPGAFRAMQGHAARPAQPLHDPMPTIVFHGTADRTVDARNAQAIVQDALGDARLPSKPQVVEAGTHTVTRHVDAHGRPHVEHWQLHGAGHAWSGGDPAGSHVDPAGPDASAEMVRFFLQHSRTIAS